MIELERSMTHKWIIDKNVNSKDILSEFASIISKSGKGFGFEEMVSRTVTQGRKDEGIADADKGSVITVGVRLLQACFYMFGYSVNIPGGRKSFMPSPMTLNILSSADRDEEARNYLVNLFCMQYPHPYDWTPECFQIYFGRLIVRLLLDERIDKRLYIDECLWFLPFIDTIDSDRYEELVDSILEYRSYDYDRKKALFESVEDHENLFANVAHEINYYLLRLFEDFGVFELKGDAGHNGGRLFRFLHSSTEKSTTYRNDAYKSRKNISGYVELAPAVMDSACRLNAAFSPFESPSRIDGVEIFTKEDWLTNIYQTEPLRYLACINTQVDRNSEIMATVSEMIRASKFGSRDGKEFENALKPFVELFREAVNVEILSGPGNTDLLCSMEDISQQSIYNVNVEAKTRGSALEEVNTSRINKHLRKHGSRFCIIVAPRFAKGVSDDITGHNIVTVRSEELGNYCYKECTNSNDGYADFTSIRELIDQNMGKDITTKVRSLTENRYGITVR